MSKSRFHSLHFHLRGHERKSSPNAHSGTKVDAINSSGQSDLPIGLESLCGSFGELIRGTIEN